nr:glycosyltransferase family 2 protein [Leptospira kobayashii]
MRAVVENNSCVIIPAKNEEGSIAFALKGLLDTELIPKENVYVVDNDSTDKTNEIARSFGVNVLFEKKRGYGNACLCALSEIAKRKKLPDWILICDGDGSDDPADLNLLIKTYRSQNADLVIGSRTIKEVEEGSLGFLQKFGNWLTCLLILIFFRQRFTDLGPFRIIRYGSLLKLNLKDKTWGWNIEMHVRALQEKMKIVEVGVWYRRRHAGVSKISGNLVMAIRVGIKILYTFFKLLILRGR